MFACGRMAGWTAHVLEQLAHNRLIRPQATYVGPDVHPLEPIAATQRSRGRGCTPEPNVARTVERTTKETQIDLRLGLDGGPIEIDTDVKFLDHMLEAFAKHSGAALQLVARGDGLDNHHLIEDVGIALGKAIHEALGEKRGIARYGSMMVPLDDALVACSIDLSGRNYLNFGVRFDGVENLGDLKTEMVREFFRAVTDNGRFNLHLVQMNGDVAHHLVRSLVQGVRQGLSASEGAHRLRRSRLNQRPAGVVSAGGCGRFRRFDRR